MDDDAQVPVEDDPVDDEEMVQPRRWIPIDIDEDGQMTGGYYADDPPPGPPSLYKLPP